jgi:4-hydroxybenzoate polyprenyltransferase/phosphoglycolate phosphatase-like HAD superfamily hydrolase
MDIDRRCRSPLMLPAGPMDTEVPGPHDHLPLCVDLDGTLVRTDTLIESAIKALLTAPLAAIAALLGLGRGRAWLKRALASIATPDPALLPYDLALVERLRAAHARGRTLVLATAADQTIAEGVSRHLGIFDAVLASDGLTNLKGGSKAASLCARFGQAGFVYVGDSPSDGAVWDRAGGAWLIAPGGQSKVTPSAPVDARFEPDAGGLAAWLRAIRLYQWVKNFLVFIPAIAAGTVAEPAVLGASLAAFASFGLVASGVYVVNDLCDLEADRRHPRKCRRPFAAGTLSALHGAIAGPLLILAGLGLALLLAPLLALCLALYVVMTTVYSLYLKTQPLVDVFTLAGLYTLRILAGSAATGIAPSIWLLSFSGALFLSLAFLKRYVEIADKARSGDPLLRRGYLADDGLPLLLFGIASCFSSAIVLALYVETAQAERAYGWPGMLWAVVPVLLFWMCRLWLSACRGYVDDDPILYAARDRISWYAIGLGSLIYLAAWLPRSGAGL